MISEIGHQSTRKGGTLTSDEAKKLLELLGKCMQCFVLYENGVVAVEVTIFFYLVIGRLQMKR